MTSRDDDPLAETAAAGDGISRPERVNADETQTGYPSQPQTPVAPGDHPATIGRYHVRGELGQGAMGVVYAADDPDLERRVAVKVLRAGGSAAARARLLREARAMARLSHPGVVTVHEVGTAGGVDYVAMELIDGTTLAEWLRTGNPTEAEVLDAFDAAGRGLAAAHAAGLVHRDFKPHNVLRSKRGRVVVTDFGLARVALEDPDPAEPPIAVGSGTTPRRSAELSRSALSGSSTLTATGALLGTPAYMAPEQHDGAAVGPAADQFAYCVAVWEAFARERPFAGATLADVRAQIERGPQPETEARIPRRLRKPLRRGLAIDPDARFPTMEALLHALRRRPARQWGFIAAAIAVAVLIGAVVGWGSTRPRPAPVIGCGDADAELVAYTAHPGRAALAADPSGAQLLASLDNYARDWKTAQRQVCGNQADPLIARRALCLRAGRAELDRALGGLVGVDAATLAVADVLEGVGDPLACASARPPARVVVDDPAAIELFRTALIINATKAEPGKPFPAMVDPGPDKPCLRVTYYLARLQDWAGRPIEQHRAELSAAADAADRCGDDVLAAGVTVTQITTDLQELLRDPTGMRRVQTAVARAGGDRFLYTIELLADGLVARLRGDIDRGIEQVTASYELSSALGTRAFIAQTAILIGMWRFERNADGDLAAAEVVLRDTLARTGGLRRPEIQRQLVNVLATAGKVADALAVAGEIDDTGDRPVPGSQPITGKVVDAAGAPVVGARVVAQQRIEVWHDVVEPTAARDRVGVTGADGTFTIAEVPPRSMIMAVAGERRTRPAAAADGLTLTIVPSGSVGGTIALDGVEPGQVIVGVHLPPPIDQVTFIGSIAADGTWRVDGVPLGKAVAFAAYGVGRASFVQTDVTVGAKPGAPVPLAVRDAGVPVHLIIRPAIDTSLTLGVAFLIRGTVRATRFRELDDLRVPMTRRQALPIYPEAAPAALREQLRAGDVVATAERVEPGTVSVCGLAITGDISDTSYMERFERYAADQTLACMTGEVTGPDQVLVLEVPPMKRLPDQ
jgi:predicted Ser/Thr protein kinase